jgi:hypothetical protein
MTRELEERLAEQIADLFMSSSDGFADLARAIAPLVERLQRRIDLCEPWARKDQDCNECKADRAALRGLMHTETGKEVCQTPNAERPDRAEHGK